LCSCKSNVLLKSGIAEVHLCAKRSVAEVYLCTKRSIAEVCHCTKRSSAEVCLCTKRSESEEHRFTKRGVAEVYGLSKCPLKKTSAIREPDSTKVKVFGLKFPFQRLVEGSAFLLAGIMKYAV